MPRVLQNFWIDAEIDGRASRVSTRTKTKEGGFEVKVRMRDEGCVTNPVTVQGFAHPDGTLTLRVEIEGQETVYIQTKR
jgi:hypothetical protein